MILEKLLEQILLIMEEHLDLIEQVLLMAEILIEKQLSLHLVK